MIQRLLTPRVCDECGADYYEIGYWGDSQYCPSCSANLRRADEQRKALLANQAADIAVKYGLDLGAVPDEMPEEVRKALNPRGAGRKARKYFAAYGELLIEAASEGKSEAEFAAGLGISQGLLQAWTEKHPRFRAAREVAREQREAWAERFFREGMAGRIPCNSSMAIRYAAAKLGWGERSESVISAGKGEIPVVRIVDRDAGFPTETLAPAAEGA